MRRMNEPVFLLAFVSLTFALAGLTKGVVGRGLPTVAMGLLSLAMPPAQAAVLLVVPSFVTNVWQAAGSRLAMLLPRMWLLLLGTCAGTWAGAGLLTADGGSWAATGLGVVLALYGISG
jgi:uncharacterized membrane protein YfcA